MKKYKSLFGAVLTTLVFSGSAIAHGVSNDSSGDLTTGHSPDHKDSVLVNPSKAQAPDMGHMNEQDKEDILHSIADHQEKLVGSPSGAAADQHHGSDDNAPNVIHEVTEHRQ